MACGAENTVVDPYSSCAVERVWSKTDAVILVDMDNTLVDWDSQFYSIMARLYPEVPLQSSRKKWNMERNYPFEYTKHILSLTSEQGFWSSMPPMEGGIKAMIEMVHAGLTVYIVTTPDSEHTARCAKEKVEWVDKHLGEEWRRRIIFTADKTLIRGDILIDDKPNACKGDLAPTWIHVLFHHPYNESHEHKPRIRQWIQWPEVIYEVLKKKTHYVDTQLKHRSSSVDSLPCNFDSEAVQSK